MHLWTIFSKTWENPSAQEASIPESWLARFCSRVAANVQENVLTMTECGTKYKDRTLAEQEAIV